MGSTQRGLLEEKRRLLMKLQEVMQQEESLAEMGSLSGRSTSRSHHSSAWGSEVSSIGSDTGNLFL
jgi:hypothetical protein